jgi:SAM-dependent methyltransferase
MMNSRPERLAPVAHRKNARKQKMLRNAIKSIAPVYKIYGLFKFAMFPLRVRKAEREDREQPVPAGEIPMPPPRLRYRVHGSLGREGFLEVGEQCAKDIKALLRQEGLDLYAFKSILDFGCGCARVLRYLRDRPATCSIHGTDIDRELIEWCQTQPSLGKFDVNPHLPPTRYADGSFDFIYSISVFTHLNEEMQLAWLRELHRITEPGGFLLLSIHGPTSYTHLSSEHQESLRTRGFTYLVGQTGVLKLDGLPDFYQSAYHSEEYIRRVWGSLFKLKKHFVKGINAHQDAILLQKL